MNTHRHPALEHAAIPWLLATALASTLPHTEHQPLWLSALSAVLFFWAGWLWHTDRRPPGKWWLMTLVILACAGILLEFHTLFGRDPGVAMLVIFMAMKLLELKSRRDATVLVTLGYFLLLTHYLYAQGIPTGLWLLACFWLITATLIRLHGGPVQPARAIFRQAAILCSQALPFMLVFYLLFPRIPGPLWGLPTDAHAGLTGLSDTMSPGSIAELVQNSDIAFRARFDGPPPAKQQRYWRGPVMEQFDGYTWRRRSQAFTKPTIDLRSPPLAYEMTLESHGQHWIFALDAPARLPDDITLAGTLTANATKSVTERRRLALAAVLDYRFNPEESTTTLAANRNLPKNINPRASELAKAWRRTHTDEREIIQEALTLYARDFTYTLRPPRLGQHSVDEFLFDTRRGFCEHFASSFVFLMRSAGIPARVIGGYQGGEFNPLDGYLVIRQSDAHAWAEVWLAGQGWVRVDPTAAVSPNRIETGIADALAEGEPLPALIQIRSEWIRTLRYRWEALNNAWNQNILGYDQRRQRDFFASLGFPDIDFRHLTFVMALASASLLGALLLWSHWKKPRRDPVVALWQRALRQLARRQVHCAPGETPLALASRVSTTYPEIAHSFQPVVDAYLRARYSPHPDLNALKNAVQHFTR